MNHDDQTLIQFQSGPHQLALPLPWVNRIEAGVDFTPNTRGMTPLGWVDSSKGRISVLDLAVSLGRSPHPNPHKAQFLFLNDSSRPMALMVDRVVRARRPQSMEISNLSLHLKGLASPLVRGIAHESPPIFLLDFEGLAHQCGLPTYPSTAPQNRTQNTRSPTSSTPVLISFPIDPQEPLQRMGLSAHQVAEILLHQNIEPLIASPPHILGFIWWRKQALPVMDMNRKLFGYSQKQAERLVVAKIPTTDQYVAILSGSDMRMERDLSTYQPIPSNPADGDLFLGTFQKGDSVLIVPNLKALCA